MTTVRKVRKTRSKTKKSAPTPSKFRIGSKHVKTDIPKPSSNLIPGLDEKNEPSNRLMDYCLLAELVGSDHEATSLARN